MKAVTFKIILLSILFLFIIISGIWLGRSGKPYNSLVFAIHKIISVFVVVYTIITIYHLQKGIGIGRAGLLLVFITGFFFLLTLISGALLSFEKPVHNAILLTHKIAPFFIFFGCSAIFYLLLVNK